MDKFLITPRSILANLKWQGARPIYIVNACMSYLLKCIGIFNIYMKVEIFLGANVILWLP